MHSIAVRRPHAALMGALGQWAAGAICAFAAGTVIAAEPGIVGLWKTFSDKTGKAESIVRVVEVDGELKGTVEKIIPRPNEDPNPRCLRCPGEFKDKPVLGLTFLWGFKRDGPGYSAGKVLDPEEGEIYSCRIELGEGGKTLRVRGYIGIPMFGRTQVWQREAQ